jgi:hypothetical protein
LKISEFCLLLDFHTEDQEDDKELGARNSQQLLLSEVLITMVDMVISGQVVSISQLYHFLLTAKKIINETQLITLIRCMTIFSSPNHASWKVTFSHFMATDQYKALVY